MFRVIFISILVASFCSVSAAKKRNKTTMKTDIDKLATQDDMVRRARLMSPKNRVRIVQKRKVNRDWRVELGVNYGYMVSGYTYTDSKVLGGNLDLHITPRWSVGVRRYVYDNPFNSEGRREFENAQNNATAGTGYDISDLNLAKSTTFGTLSFYPLYGKINIFDWTTAQFDVYLLAGYGQVQFNYGNSTPTTTAGGGVGLWLHENIAARAEIRFQGYEERSRITDEVRQINSWIAGMSLGILLF